MSPSFYIRYQIRPNHQENFMAVFIDLWAYLFTTKLCCSSEVTLTFLFLSILFLFYSRSVVDMSAVKIDPSEGLVIELDFSAGEDEDKANVE